MISKVAVLKGRYVRVYLDEAERNFVMNKLLEYNMAELDRIIKRLAKFNSNEMPPVEVVRSLFEKQGMSSFTALINALDEKVSMLKDKEKQEKDEMLNAYKESPKGKSIDNEINGLGKTKPSETESLVEEAMEKQGLAEVRKEMLKGLA
jgi:hypothetical protein